MAHLLVDGVPEGHAAHLGAHHFPELVSAPVLDQPHQPRLLPVHPATVIPALTEVLSGINIKSEIQIAMESYTWLSLIITVDGKARQNP